MSADLVFRDAAAPADPDSNLQVRYENTIGTPITSATYVGDGRAMADDYTLVFTVSGSATVTVACQSKNPWYNLGGLPVTCDGATVNYDIIPGVAMVFSASTVTGWTAKVGIGELMATDGTGTARFDFGIVQNGTITTGFRVALVNVGGDDASASYVVALPGIKGSGANYSTFITSIDNHSSDARHKMAVTGTYAITFTNWADGTGDAAGYKVADVNVDGNLCITAAIFDGSTVYEYGSGNGYDDGNDYLKGMQITLALTTSDPTSSTIDVEVTDGWQWLEFAADSSGTPGTYSSADLTITESGESSGTITAGGTGFLWAHLNVPSAAAIGTMKKVNLKAICLST